MKNKIFRFLICFLLVCCLLVRISPIQAEAVSTTAVALSVGIPVAVAVGLQALGVRQGSSSTAFNQVVNDCVDALSPSWAVNGLTTMLALTTDGITRTFANRNFLQAILDCLLGNDVLVSEGIPYVTSCSYVWNSDSYSISVLSGKSGRFCFVKFFYESYFYYGAVASGSSSFDYSLYENGSLIATPYCYAPSGSLIHLKQFDLDSGDDPTAFVFSGLPIIDLGTLSNPNDCTSIVSGMDLSNVSLSTPYDLTLEDVGTDIETDYETYAATGTTDEDGIPWVPTTIPSLSTDTFVDQTQAEAQAGTTSEAIVEELIGTQTGTDTETGTGTVTGTATLADVIAEIKAIPASIADFFADVIAAVKAVPVAIADVFTPSGTVEAYSLDLKQFFPFCIPYDIYSMLAALAADPVAPKFDFEIDMGPVGILPISVDFSEWDDVAALLRTCEAALFAVGLAVKTKELIGW